MTFHVLRSERSGFEFSAVFIGSGPLVDGWGLRGREGSGIRDPGLGSALSSMEVRSWLSVWG